MNMLDKMAVFEELTNWENIIEKQASNSSRVCGSFLIRSIELLGA